ncbi:hypothetical protein CsSME_00004089 [Camellia sinensis var. sinensis]
MPSWRLCSCTVMSSSLYHPPDNHNLHFQRFLPSFHTQLCHQQLRFPTGLPYSLHNQISHLQTQLGVLLEQLHSETSEPKAILKFSDQVLTIDISIDKLAETLSGLYSNAPNSRNETSNVEEDLSEPEESKVEEGSVPGKVFNSAELHSYISPKPNRINGKKNFLGLEAINPSIGLGCVGMASNTDRFMAYKMIGTWLRSL